MIFRLKKVNHPLTMRGEYCAGMFVHELSSGHKTGLATPVMFAWGKTWEIALKNCVARNRRVRQSSKIARTKEETMHIEQINNTISKEQLKLEIEKVRSMIHTARGVSLAAKALDIDTEAMRKLEDSRRHATNSLLVLAPRQDER